MIMYLFDGVFNSLSYSQILNYLAITGIRVSYRKIQEKLEVVDYE